MESAISIKFRQVNDCLPLRAELCGTGIPLPTLEREGTARGQAQFSRLLVCCDKGCGLPLFHSEIPSASSPSQFLWVIPFPISRQPESEGHSQGQKVKQSQ